MPRYPVPGSQTSDSLNNGLSRYRGKVERRSPAQRERDERQEKLEEIAADLGRSVDDVVWLNQVALYQLVNLKGKEARKIVFEKMYAARVATEVLAMAES